MSNQHSDLFDLKKVYYAIAGLIVEIECPSDLQLDEVLPSFKDFKTSISTGDQTICSIRLYVNQVAKYVNLGRTLTNLSIVWGDKFRFYENDNYYVTTLDSATYEDQWSMMSLKDFSKSKIYISTEELNNTGILSWLMMVTFAQASILHKTILIHASTIELDNQGYAFLGKSGTGKSTHSKRWLETFPEARLLNDDNPAIRMLENGEVFIYGTPWSGKTPCYINRQVPLKALIRLHQAPKNEFTWTKGIDAFIKVLPSCSAIRWNSKLFNTMSNTLEEIIKKVPIGYLACLPNSEAAQLCYTESKNKNL